MGLIWGFSTSELDLSRYLSPWNCTDTVLTWTCLSGEQQELLFVHLLWDHFTAGGDWRWAEEAAGRRFPLCLRSHHRSVLVAQSCTGIPAMNEGMIQLQPKSPN